MTKLSNTKIGYPILADLPTYPYPIISDFRKPTYLPKLRISFMDGTLVDIKIVSTPFSFHFQAMID